MEKRIVVLGAGESGVGAAILAQKKGYNVFVSDMGAIAEKHLSTLKQYNIEFEQEKHTEEKILNADEIIKSPGIPDKADIIKKIKTKGINIISEIEFAYRYSTGKVIGITGSNGKSTTTGLIYHILKQGGLDVAMTGNIGYSFAKRVAENDAKYYVIELSSFQLDDIKDFKCHIAILLNITPDHLDRYEYNFQNYIDSKFRIALNQKQTDYFIYCEDDEVIMSNLSQKNIIAAHIPFSINKKVNEGGFLENNEIIIDIQNNQFTMPIDQLALQGKHNLYNSMAASIVANILGIRKETIRESLNDFKNLEHRLEPVATIKGVEFINDSKATNVNSTWYALETMNKPVILILGGIDKGNDYTLLESLIKQKVKAIVCLGKENEKIHQAFSDSVDLIVDTKSAEEAVRNAFELGEKGDVVLLSPACASFDLFQNYEDRGMQFKQAVKSL